MAGGKGGSQTTTTAIPKWQEDMVRDAVAQAKGLNVPYAPYMGVDVVAQDPNINANTNSALSAFGMTPIENTLPPTTTQGGITGYRSYDLYQDQLANLKENYPDIYRRIEAQTAETLPQASTIGQVNPVTGYPITPQASEPIQGEDINSIAQKKMNDDNWGASPHTGGSMNWGFGDSGMFKNSPTEWDFGMFDPIGDTWDYLTNAKPQPPRNMSDEYMSFYGNTDEKNEPTP